MTRAVFVSYSQSDRDAAYEVVARVEASGIDCWVAPRDIAPSAEWAAEIMDAISVAAVMVLVFSADSNRSPQVRREVERAVHKSLPVIAFRVDDVLPEKSLEYFLSAQHWLDAFTVPREAHYEKLIHHLQRALQSRAATPPAMTERGSAPTYSAVVLSQLERQLAIRLGPVARILVQRAASRASSIEELRVRLAEELGSEQERSAFMAGTSHFGESQGTG
jgi:TIR domain-containing protein